MADEHGENEGEDDETGRRRIRGAVGEGEDDGYGGGGEEDMDEMERMMLAQQMAEQEEENEHHRHRHRHHRHRHHRHHRHHQQQQQAEDGNEGLEARAAVGMDANQGDDAERAAAVGVGGREAGIVLDGAIPPGDIDGGGVDGLELGAAAAAAAAARGGRLGMGGGPPRPHRRSYLKMHYAQLSVLSAVLLVLYALRTRGQAYLALTYLTSSKMSYIVLGNAVVSAAVSAFHLTTRIFLGGLRQAETEAIGESIRWNVTETCIALTIFRSEVDVAMGGMFLLLVVGKCLHWAAELRGSNLRMTEEAFYFLDGSGGGGDEGGGAYHVVDESDRKALTRGYFWRLGDVLLPDPVMLRIRTLYVRCPRIRRTHAKFVALVELLLLCDVAAVGHCALTIAEYGPSVHILFGFEAAILAVTALSILATYELHVVDGMVTVLHHLVDPTYHAGLGLYHGPDDAPQAERRDGDGNGNGNPPRVEGEPYPPPPPPPTAARRFLDRVSASWRDRRATLSFFIELLAQSLKFLFYLLFFAIVFTYYGMPINIFREVYVSYQQLRRRLSAFANYRRLTSNMNERFDSVTNESELDELGRTCIICRDRMDAGGGCKRLPMCGHAFHKHCLREWLVQQQSCPTCRGDIAANEARQRTERKRREREQAEAEAEAKVETDADTNTDAGRGMDGPPPAAPGMKEQQDTDHERLAADAKEKPKEGPVAFGLTPRDVLLAANATKPAVDSATSSPPRGTVQNVFPALYRCKGPDGSKVYVREDATAVATATAESGIGRPPITSVRRTVPPGKIILCTGMVWWVTEDVRDADESSPVMGKSDCATAACGGSSVGGMMLKMPDGYVSERDVERLASLCATTTTVKRNATVAERAAEDECVRMMAREMDDLRRQVANLRAGLASNV